MPRKEKQQAIIYEGLEGIKAGIQKYGKVVLDIPSAIRMLTRRGVTIHSPDMPNTYLRYENEYTVYLWADDNKDAIAPVDGTSATAAHVKPDGIARIVAARKQHAIRNSIGYDLKSKSEASLTDVAIDVLAGKMDSFGIVRKHPDRDEQLEIAGVLIAAMLDVRAAINSGLIEQHAKIDKAGAVEAGTCICGFCGKHKVVLCTLNPGRLWVKYQCPSCERLGERSWLE